MSPAAWLLVLISFLAAVLVRGWLAYRSNTRKVGGMPGVRQWISPGHLLMMAQVIPETLFGFRLFRYRTGYSWTAKYQGLYPQFGRDIISFTSYDTAMVTVADAAMIKQVTGNRIKYPKPVEYYGVLALFGDNVVTTEGDLWRTHRRVAAPSFSDRNNRLVVEQSVKHTSAMFQHWHQQSGDPRVAHVCIDQEMIKLALYIISGAGFGIELSWDQTDATPKGHKLSFLAALEVVAYHTLARLVVPRWMFKWLPVPFLRKIDLGFEEFDKYIASMVKGAKKRIANASDEELSPTGEKQVQQADLLTALVEASMEKGEDGKAVFSDSDLSGNIFIFLLAGHETTAHTLIYALALLALHPKFQEKLYAEVSAVLGPSNPPTYEDMNQLVYAQCVFNEALRLYPPVVMIPKKFSEDTVVDGHRVEKDTYLNVHVAALHRNPKYWKEPDQFIPDRFDTRQDPNAFNRDAFLPFSDGMRSCLGKRFAQVEGICVLAMISQQYTVQLADPENADFLLESKEILTLTPVNPVKLKFTKRT